MPSRPHPRGPAGPDPLLRIDAVALARGYTDADGVHHEYVVAMQLVDGTYMVRNPAAHPAGTDGA